MTDSLVTVYNGICHSGNVLEAVYNGIRRPGNALVSVYNGIGRSGNVLVSVYNGIGHSANTPSAARRAASGRLCRACRYSGMSMENKFLVFSFWLSTTKN
jgi:hypothetical protein